MYTTDKINPDVTGFWIALILLLTIAFTRGEAALRWIMMELYDFFVRKGAV